MFMGTTLILIILLQAAKWSIVEAEASQARLSDDIQIRQWLTDKLGAREGMFTFDMRERRIHYQNDCLSC